MRVRSTRRSPSSHALLIAIAATLVSSLLPAQGVFADEPEPWLISLEPGLAIPISSPQSARFGPGLTGSIAVQRALHPTSLLALRLRGGLLFDGPAPTEPSVADPGLGSFNSLTFAYRLRPLGRSEDVRRGTGLFFEVAGGAMLTGSDVRATAELAAGYGFEWGIADVGPVLRYIHTFQGSGNFEDRDASLLILGVEVTFLDARAVEVEQDDEPVIRDRDGDGIMDPDDACPLRPEDADGFEDEDGCPDLDNDEDTILDVADSCPMTPEDLDGFEDDDGCPDPDNDGDGFLDVDDACPNEAEVVNGVDDDDGCPDVGLIEMVNDRVVLEETVLFDFQRARVKSAAGPVIAAIVELVRQHPEWDSMRIEGHADIRGNEDYNRRLSERRARNVMRALVRAGVDGDRIDSVGFGADRPRDHGRTEEAHQRNRRVEFVVLRQVPATELGQATTVEETIEAPAVPVQPLEEEDAMVFESDAAATEGGTP